MLNDFKTNVFYFVSILSISLDKVHYFHIQMTYVYLYKPFFQNCFDLELLIPYSSQCLFKLNFQIGIVLCLQMSEVK